MVSIDPVSVITDGLMFGVPPAKPTGLLTLPLAVASMGFLKVVAIAPPVVEITSRRIGRSGAKKGQTLKNKIEEKYKNDFDLFLKVSIMALGQKTGTPEKTVEKHYVGTLPDIKIFTEGVDTVPTKPANYNVTIENVLSRAQGLPNIKAEVSKSSIKPVTVNIVDPTKKKTDQQQITIGVSEVVLKKPDK